MVSYLNRIETKRSRPGRRRLKNIRDWNKVISNTWLEYVFGWAPLVADINGAVKAFADTFVARVPTEHVVSGSKERKVSNGPSYFWSPDNEYKFFHFASFKETIVELKYTGGIYAYTESGGASVTQNLGLGLRNFIPTVWELIPYSFVADYFGNIGDCLEALAFNKADIIYCNRILKTTVRQQFFSDDGFKDDAVLNIAGLPEFKVLRDQGDTGQCKMTYFSYQRNVVPPSTLMPSLRFKVPGLFSKQSLNLTALVAKGRRLTNLLTRN
jgi:hypothetical protein